ncbi:hypothetical protein UFOVP94_37 [uncultured Caudovirales phage]|uniref:Uncharacterized protein n=1 Tax=uncultured Caudovirales phage TaxID=2100421 RepID=A0A6J7WEE4_9CAUD|nr:hypothetical protein UFOVP94_37 [uncultured Caudovirales phage]CAB5212352.1 hypothetical protein UFOVP186_6 [uncultured Caudovirales phage]
MLKDSDRQVQDIKILQKVNSAHREAFREKFPGQLEHCLRLMSERLQAGLDKRDGVDLTNPETWKLLPHELAELSSSMYYIYCIRASLDAESEQPE